jgi:ABC-type iron transport system FetAB permease component
MVRLLAIAIGLLIVAWLILRVVKAARDERIDWRSIGFICLFIILAFWLHDATGIG